LQSSVFQKHVDWEMSTNASQEHIASIFWVQNEGSMFLSKVGAHSPTTLHGFTAHDMNLLRHENLRFQ
jgi:hypothetical protein